MLPGSMYSDTSHCHLVENISTLLTIGKGISFVVLIMHIATIEVQIFLKLKDSDNVMDLGGADGRVLKVLDLQPQDHGFKSRHTLGLLCLKSLGKICTPNVPCGDR